MACRDAALSSVSYHSSEWSTRAVGLFTMQMKGFWSSCPLLVYLSASLCVAAIIPLWSRSLPGARQCDNVYLRTYLPNTPSLFACQHLTLWFLLQKWFLVKKNYKKKLPNKNQSVYAIEQFVCTIALKRYADLSFNTMSFCLGKINCQLWQNGEINNMHVIFLIACCFFVFYYFIKDYVLVHVSGFVACVSWIWCVSVSVFRCLRLLLSCDVFCVFMAPSAHVPTDLSSRKCISTVYSTACMYCEFSVCIL